MKQQFLLVVLFAVLASVAFGQFGETPAAGGFKDIDLATADEDTLQDLNITSDFAVQEINNRVEGGMMDSEEDSPVPPLQLVGILNAGSQVVMGIKYRMTLNTTDAMEDYFLYNVDVVYISWMDSLEMTDVQLV